VSSKNPDGEAAGRQRVGRPRSLTIAEIVTASVEIADDHGLESLSMPSLAKHLGVGTMTLYGYVENKEDLLDKVAARLFENLQIPENRDWQEGMIRFFSDFREAAIAHPALAGLLATGRVTIPAVFDILESFFRETTRDGLPVEEAVRVFYAGLTYTIGFVLWEVPRAHLQPEASYGDQWDELISRLEPAEYPILTDSAPATAKTVASTTQFNWGLARIIQG
jgi:TetR/AcrR family tetracycline transcriptional repressor